MAIPKSPKLKAEESKKTLELPSVVKNSEITSNFGSGPIEIREVKCCNDFVAILQFTIESSVALPNTDSKYRNEGLIVGVGPGVSDGAGGRLAPTVAIGDVVIFGEKNIISVIESDSKPYVDKKIVIVSERNIICKLHRTIEFTMITD